MQQPHSAQRNSAAGGPGQLINFLQGLWLNADCQGEQYVIQGLQVTRTDSRGTRRFSIRWDQRGQRWQWGTRGRLSLQWLGNDAIAWVPEVGGHAQAGRLWRWQRCRLTPATSGFGEAWRQPAGRRYHETLQLYPRAACHRSQWLAEPQRTCRSRSRRAYQRRYHHSHRGGHDDHARRHHRSRHHRIANEAGPNGRLPCGLTSAEVLDLFSRDITPEDYDLLLRLDETVEKPTVNAESVEKLPDVACMEFAGGDCRICLTAFEDDDKVTSLPCGHNFHRDCIATWLSKYNRTCPLCHEEVPLDKDSSTLQE